MHPPIDLFHRRIAITSIGASTVRGQPEKTVAKAREYLEKSVNLSDFSKINENEFKKLLDDHTERLRDNLPEHRWGIARKALNIFLFQAVQNIFLNRQYNLNQIISYLELPLDNPNAKKLRELAKEDGKTLIWKNIVSLNPESSNQFQEYARQYANQKLNCERCYLDLYLWHQSHAL